MRGRKFLDLRARAKGRRRDLVALYVWHDPVRGPRVRCRVVGETRQVLIAQARLLNPRMYEEVPTCTCDGWCRGRRYTCAGCKRFVPYCFGGVDDGPAHELCDDCWTAHEAEPGRVA